MVKVTPITFGPQHHFFGFHDLCPWDQSGRYMLAMETDFIDRPPTAKDKARVCLIDLEGNNKLEVLAETSAWNFHQGCRAQWLPDDPEKIIYNNRINDQFVSVILDVRNRKEVRVLEYPVYAVSPGGGFGLGLDFDWLGRHGGYGYALVGGKSDVDHGPEILLSPEYNRGGITRIDFKTGKADLVPGLSAYDIARLENSPLPNEFHFLIHVAFNPSGERICFLDKYRLPDGGFMQRLITANSDGSDRRVLPGHVTHYCWKSDNEILAFGKYSPSVMALRQKGFSKNRILKPFLNIARKMRGTLKQRIAGQSYFLLKDKTQEVERIAVGVMTEDGHPQFSPDGRWVITDTYPDKNHERTLILYDWKNKKRIDLGKFKSMPDKKCLTGYHSNEPWDISQMRADLHPRWSRDGRRVCIDSAHEGTRQMYVVDVGNAISD